jgi:hypothetical protein
MPEERPRRRVSDAAIESLAADVNALSKRVGELAAAQKSALEEAREHRLRMHTAIQCCSSSLAAWDARWQDKYQPYLDAEIASDKERRDFIKEKVKTWTSWVANAAAIFLLVVISYGVASAELWQRIWAKLKALI